MAKASRTMSLIEEQRRDNSILSIWTKKNGLIVRPWYKVDKVVYDVIEVGEQGAGIQVCQSTLGQANCLDDWAYDILSSNRRFEAIMQAESKAGEKYPKAYKWVTGESAEKSIGIANSSSGNGYVINVNEGNKHYNIPVSFHDLRRFSEAYLRSYETRKEELEQIRLTAEAESLKARQAAKANKAKDQTTAKTAESQSPQENKNNSTMSVKTTSPVEKIDGFARFTGIDTSAGTGEILTIVLKPNVISAMGTNAEKFFNRINAKAAESGEGVSFKMNYTLGKSNGKIIYFMKGFATV